MSTSKSCMHIKVSGVRCGSPSMRGEQFCYFHLRMLRTVRGPASRVHHAALLEDDESIQASLIETVNALLQGTIELKRAELVLRALNTAVRNIRRVHFGLHPERMVKEIPDYSTPPLEQVDEQYAKELRRREEREEIKRVYAAAAAEHQAASAKAAPVHSCGDGSSTRPGGPEVPGRSALPPKPDQAKPTEAALRARLCGDGSSTRPGGPEVSGRSAPPRKPPVSVKESSTKAFTKPSKERQIAQGVGR
jgi:hypothetical protein